MLSSLVIGACLSVSLLGAEPQVEPAAPAQVEAPKTLPVALVVDPVTKIDTARKLSAASAAKLKKARQTLNRCKRGRCPIPQVQAILEDAAKDFAAVDLLLTEASTAAASCAQVADTVNLEAQAAVAEAAALDQAGVANVTLDANALGMPAEEFTKLLAEVDAQVFAEDRILLVRDATAQGRNFNCSQAAALLAKLTASADRLDLLKVLKGRLADTQNLDVIYAELHHPADLEEARHILEGAE